MENIDYIFIIGQVLGFVAFFISCIKFFKKDKATLMKYSVVSYLFYIVHFLCIGAIAGSYTLVIAAARDYYIYLREKHHKKHRTHILYNNPLVFVVLFAIYVTLIILNISEPKNILPLAAGLVYLWFEWFTTNKTTIKTAAIFTTLPWIVYSVLTFSIAGVVSDTVSVVVCAIGIFKDKKLRKHVVRNHH